MTDDKLLELESKARAATPGPWAIDTVKDTAGEIWVSGVTPTDSESDGFLVETRGNHGSRSYSKYVCQPANAHDGHERDNDSFKNMQYIAAASPDVILALIKEIYRYRELMKQTIPGTQDTYEALVNEVGGLRQWKQDMLDLLDDERFEHRTRGD
jgi:hypothetical protein